MKPITAKKINTVIKPNPGISYGNVPSKGEAFLSKNFIKPPGYIKCNDYWGTN